MISYHCIFTNILWFDNLFARNWPCGLVDKALVLGTKDCRFESCQGQLFQKILNLLGEGVTPFRIWGAGADEGHTRSASPTELEHVPLPTDRL